MVLSVSGSYPTGRLCYLGQTIPTITGVELELTDATSTQALLVPAPLPVILWVAITDDRAVPIAIRANDSYGRLRREPVDAHWLEPRSSAVWGPIDYDE